MKKFALKMVSCIVLATVMVLAGVLPSMASGSDDLTGWTVGTSNTITGNPTDGWDLALSGGSIFDTDTYALYAFDGFASELQITMNISAMEAGKDFWFQLGDQPGDIYHWTWNGTKMTLCFKRVGDNLEIYGHDGGKETTHAVIESFDFTIPHVIEFLKDGSDKYQLAVDGELCLIPWAAGVTGGTVDDYVTTGGAENDVIVGFFTGAGTIKDVKISKKVTSNPTPTPTETPTATSGSASATPGVSNQPTGDVPVFGIVALVLAFGTGLMVLRKKSCKE